MCTTNEPRATIQKGDSVQELILSITKTSIVINAWWCPKFVEMVSVVVFVSLIFVDCRQKNPENEPNMGRDLNTQTFGKMYLFVIRIWLAVIGFRQNYFYILPNIGDFGAKMSFFHYIINPKRNNYIKHCPPVYQEVADIRDVFI